MQVSSFLSKGKLKKNSGENLLLKQKFKNQLEKAVKESKSKKARLLPLKNILQ